MCRQRRLIGKRVRFPRGPAAVKEELSPEYHWETGKVGKSDEPQARRPACFMHHKLYGR